MLLVGENLATGIMYVEVHLISKGELLHQSAELLQRIEEADTTPSVEVVGLYQPDISTIVHISIQDELSGWFVLGLDIDTLVR